jgi:hypothetical protein
MDMYAHFNFVEGLFWIILAILIGTRSFKAAPILQKIYFAAGIILLAFGCSDFVEMRTGAWWRPWWLLVWKGGCLTGFVLLLVWYYLLKKRNIRPKE